MSNIQLHQPIQQPMMVLPPVYQPQIIQTNQHHTSSKPQEIIVYLTEKPSIWSSGLCDCCVNPSICLQGCFCPCFLFGKNMENAFNESFCTNCLCYCFCCGPSQHSGKRRKLRVKYNLPTDPCNDCCLAWFCPTCSLCQEANEIRAQLIKGPPDQQFMV